jgi:hypothetical protein
MNFTLISSGMIALHDDIAQLFEINFSVIALCTLSSTHRQQLNFALIPTIIISDCGEGSLNSLGKRCNLLVSAEPEQKGTFMTRDFPIFKYMAMRIITLSISLITVLVLYF